MSGRVKQRTKGNTKPSSSGRAAELMSRDGTIGFVGFGDARTSPDGSSLQFVPSSVENPEVSVHSDFLVVMKKLSKRDSVTKLKAVQEFGELCKTIDMKAVLGVLKYWPRLYNKLALDVDYRVREATQHAMNQIMSRVGKNFAPHLKSVMGVWLCSQCDTYLPVATAAQKAFKNAFSENKQAEVLGFCKKEINEYLVENLTNQTADTLSDPDVVDEKDRSAKYVRVIAASLQALGKFLKMVDKNISDQVVDYHRKLIGEKKFWKLGRHKSPQIRAAFFFLVSVYCEKQATFIESFSSSVCPIVLGSLDESDAIVSAALWEAVLQLVTRFKDCWKYVNLEKAVLPKFWQFLSNAGYGNAQLGMVNVLPFISMLPQKVVCPSSGFAQKLFEKILDGLKLIKTQQSPSESKAVLSAFMDCVQYFISFDSEQLRVHVIDRLIDVVEMWLAPKTRFLSSFFFERLMLLLQDTSGNSEFQDYFWKKLDQAIMDKVECSEQDISASFQSMVDLLTSLKSRKSSQETQPSKVHFQDTSNNKDTKSRTKKLPNVMDVDVTVLYGGRLLATARKTVCSCLERILSKSSSAHLSLATELVKEFFTSSLLNDILISLKQLSGKDPTTREESLSTTSTSKDIHHFTVCTSLIDEFVLSLLDTNLHGADEKWMSCAVQLLFLFIVEVEEKNQKCVLHRVFQVNYSSQLLYLIVKEIFETELYLYLSYVHGIYIGERIKEVLSDILQNQEREDSRYIWRAIELCFLHSNILDFFLSESLLCEVFHNFHLVLAQGNSAAISNTISVLQLIQTYVENNDINSSQYEDFLSEVLMDIVQLKLFGEEEAHVSLLWNSLTSSALTDSSWFEAFTSQTAQQIHDHVFCNHSITIEQVSVITEAAVEIVVSLTKNDEKNFTKFLAKLSPTDLEWNELRSRTLSESTWAVVPFLDGGLSFTQFSTAAHICINDLGKLTNHEIICLLLSRALNQRYTACFSEDSETEWRIFIELLWLREYFTQTTLIARYKKSSEACLTILERNLQPLLDGLTDNYLLLTRLFAMSKSGGGLWSLTLKSVLTGVLNDECISYVDLLFCEEDGEIEHRLHTLQCLLTAEASIYNIKVTVENCCKNLEGTESSNITGQMFYHSILSSAFEKWIQLAQDSEVAKLECRMTLLEVLNDIRSCQPTLADFFLFSCSLDSVDVPLVSFNMAIIRLMKMIAMHFAENLDSDLWDMILCSMLDWLQSCADSNVGDIKVIALTNHVCQLFEVVGKILSKADCSLTGADCDEENCSANETLMKKLANEWREFFSVSASGNLLRLWSRIVETDTSDNPQLSVSCHRLSETLSTASCYVTTEDLKQYTLSSCVASLMWQEDCFGKFLPCIESNFSAFQLAAYKLLLNVVPSLQTPKEIEGCVDDEEPCRSPPSELMEIVAKNQHKILAILLEADVPFGETLGLEDDFEASHFIRTYLLAWKLLLLHFSNSDEELRVLYANYLRREKYLNELLGILFRLLARKPSALEEESCFAETFLLDEEFVHNLAFETYVALLRTLPALVRQWWNNLEKKYALVVERYTTSYISPLLGDKELQTIQNTSSKHENMEIVTRSSTREVIAYYKIEDISIELIVSLSASYPLGGINVTCGKRVGVKLNQWRLWMMQLTTFLMHQNGTILDGLLLWKRNVDKKFEGVDDCMICFSVIHGSNYSLPRLSCKTCKKKFHSACLYRWFSTSNNSTCPMCRNLF